MRRLILALALLLVPGLASAQQWTMNCQSGINTNSVMPGAFACYDLADTATTDSETLNVQACENFDVFFIPDYVAAGGTATTNIMMSLNAAATAASSWILENTTLDGDASTDTEAIYGAAGVWLWSDPQDAGEANDIARVIVKCNR